MIDPQHIVERIRAFMASTDEPRSPELVELASSYATLCLETNARLRRCRDYLRRGLRAEAIHEADEPPALLDQIALLDIPEATDWARACQTYDLSRPPPLLVQAARELSEAYETAQPLRALLDKHRKLALHRAPLSQRLSLLRDLARIDPGTHFWNEDIESFEQIRFRELFSQAKEAVKASDRPEFVRIRNEVNSSPWKAAVPEELRSLVDQTEVAWLRQEAGREIGLLLPPLHAAFSAQDFDGASQLHAQIRHCLADAQMDAPRNLAAELAPVKEWITAERLRREQQSKFEAAVNQLQLALDAQAPMEELQRLMIEASVYEQDVPAGIARRYDERKKQHRRVIRQQMWRSRLIVVGVLLVCAGMASVVVRGIVRDRRLHDAYDLLAPLVAAAKWDEANKAYDALSNEVPYAMQRPEFQRLRSQMDDAASADRLRLERFARQMKAAEEAGADSPDNSALAEAQSLARSVQEVKAVEVLRLQADAAQAARRLKDMDAQKQALAALVVQADWLQNQAKAGLLAPSNSTMAETQSSVTRLLQAPGLPDDLKQDADRLAARLRTLQDSVMKSASEADALSLVIASTARVNDLRDALKLFVQKNPASLHAAGFTQAIADAPKWEAIDEGSRLITSWEGKLEHPVFAFTQRGDGLAEYASKFPASPFNPIFENYRSYLSFGQRALAAEGPWKSELKTLLDTPIVKEMHSIRTTDGKTYYLGLDANLKISSVGTSFMAIMSGDVGNTKQVTLKPAQLNGAKPTDSPQSILAADLAKKLEGLDETNWETFGVDVIDTLLSHKDVDPILQVMLLSRCAKMAQQATWGAGDAMASLDTMTASLNADDIAWMNPTDAAANEARQRAQAILSNLAPLSSLRALIANRKAEMLKSLRIRVVGHGVLLHEGDAWHAAGAAKFQGPLEAMAVVGDGARSTLQRIGQIEANGNLAVDPLLIRGVPDGEMIFILDRK